jgi:hypothetical protein
LPPGGPDCIAEGDERFLQPASISAAINETPMSREATVPLDTKDIKTPE